MGLDAAAERSRAGPTSTGSTLARLPSRASLQGRDDHRRSDNERNDEEPAKCRLAEAVVGKDQVQRAAQNKDQRADHHDATDAGKRVLHQPLVPAPGGYATVPLPLGRSHRTRRAISSRVERTVRIGGEVASEAALSGQAWPRPVVTTMSAPAARFADEWLRP